MVGTDVAYIRPVTIGVIDVRTEGCLRLLEPPQCPIDHRFAEIEGHEVHVDERVELNLEQWPRTVVGAGPCHSVECLRLRPAYDVRFVTGLTDPDEDTKASRTQGVLDQRFHDVREVIVHNNHALNLDIRPIFFDDRRSDMMLVDGHRQLLAEVDDRCFLLAQLDETSDHPHGFRTILLSGDQQHFHRRRWAMGGGRNDPIMRRIDQRERHRTSGFRWSGV